MIIKEFNNRTEYYNDDGYYHREDGPAVIWNNGDKEWCQNGLFHRTDGPAIEYSNDIKFWYINGNKISEEEFKLYIFTNKL